MPTNIVALAYALFAIGGAYYLFGAIKLEQAKRIYLAWAAVACVIFLFPSKLFVLVLLFPLLTFFSPKEPSDRVAFYVALLAAAPNSLSAYVPFPGLNYLIELDYLMISTLAILAPLLMARSDRDAAARNFSLEALVLLFVLVTTALSTRSLSATSVMRLFIDQFIVFYIPVRVIGRHVNDSHALDKVFRALLISLVIMTFVGVISTLRDWNFYNWAGSSMGRAEFRNGFLRIEATLMTGLLALMLGVAIMALLERFRAKELKFFRFASLAGAMALCCYFTGARGGWLAAMVAGCVYFVGRKGGGAALRLTVAIVFAGVAFSLWRIVDDPSYLDRDDNIGYRAELFRVSVRQIAQEPLFGNPNFRELPAFRHLVQGDGIVDVVNVYLEVALTFGLIGLLITLSMFWIAMGSAIKALAQTGARTNFSPVDASARGALAIGLASLIGFSVLILTTSGVSYVWTYALVLMTLTRAGASIVLTAPLPETARADGDDSGEPAVTSTSAQSRSGKFSPQRPYGLRHVRRS